jgi:hypothetical protein
MPGFTCKSRPLVACRSALPTVAQAIKAKKSILLFAAVAAGVLFIAPSAYPSLFYSTKGNFICVVSKSGTSGLIKMMKLKNGLRSVF